MSVKLKTPSNGSVILSPEDTASDVVVNVPAVAGEILVGGTLSTSTTNTVTNKIPVVINGTTYYLLASTSGL